MSSEIRHQWIENALKKFREHFTQCGYQAPTNVRVSVGFTKGNKHKKALGQCFNKVVSTDDHYEMFISPIVGKIDNPEADKLLTINILETVAHELIHVTVGCEEGHRGKFIICAQAVGFIKPWSYIPAGEKMKLMIDQIISELGLYPAGAIVLPKKQGQSLVKCQCDGCDFVAYITRKQLEAKGTPVCPNDMEAMWCD